MLETIDKDLQVHSPDNAGTAHCYKVKSCCCKGAKVNDMQLLLLTGVLGWCTSVVEELVSIADLKLAVDRC